METTKNNQRNEYFEYLCYILAGICAIMFVSTPTTKGTIVNIDGSNTALRWEIAFFGWLIVGRITALINKKDSIKHEQQPQIALNSSEPKDKLSDNTTENQAIIKEDFELFKAFMSELKPIYNNTNDLYQFKEKAKPIVIKYNDKASAKNLSIDFSTLLDEAYLSFI